MEVFDTQLGDWPTEQLTFNRMCGSEPSLLIPQKIMGDLVEDLEDAEGLYPME